MHKIESLQIFGFKSFCDKIDITLNGEVTAIVGPNGCGKSNIADAINWVLGEQSTKSLRADRMEDVIFNGTQRRKPLGVAEVTLILRDFSNGHSNGTLPTDDGQISVARRLYRSGESEYFLNGRRCRLKDIHEFFQGTGLGATSYALIEQGKIELILSAKPQDRRGLIEEAARIALFKSKRKAAEMKLELAQQNLARVNDIIHEVDRQISSLKRQAAKARRYYRLCDELKYFSRIRFWNTYKKLTADIRSFQERLNEFAGRERELLAKLQAEEETRKRVLAEIEGLERQVAEGKDELSALQLEAGRATQLRSYQEEQLHSLEERRAEIEEARRDSAGRLDAVRREISAAKESLVAVTSEMAAKSEEIGALQEKPVHLTEQIDAIENEMQRLRTSTLGEGEQLSDLKRTQVRIEENLQYVSDQIARLEEEKERNTAERAQLERQNEELNAALTANETTWQHQANEMSSETARAEALKKQEAEKEEELQILQAEFNQAQHRLASLEEIEARRTMYSEAVQRFLSAIVDSNEIRVVGTLADFIETDPRFEAAVEDLLQEQLQHIVVEDLEDAIKGVAHLKRLKSGRCTFLALNARNGNGAEKHPAPVAPAFAGIPILGYLKDILSASPRVKEAFARAFPQLDVAILVEDLDKALQLASANLNHLFLTLDGEIVSARGIVSAVGERKVGVGFLSLKRERKELSARIEEYRNKIESAKAALSGVKIEIEKSAAYRTRIGQELHALELERTGLKHTSNQVEASLEKIGKIAAGIAAEITRLEKEHSRLEEELRDTGHAIASMEIEGKARVEKLLQLEAQLPPLKAERKALLDDLSALRLEIAAKTERQKAFSAELSRLTLYEEELRTRLEKLAQEIRLSEERCAELQASNEELALKVDALLIRKAYLEEALASQQTKLAEGKAAAADAEQKLATLRDERQQSTEQKNLIEVEKARYENDLHHLQMSCREEFHEDLDALVRNMTDDQLEYDTQQAEQNYHEVKEKLENFGALNMRALEEYQELEQRHQFLLSQQQDIQTSITATQEAIAEINRRSTEQFKETFDRINENFRQLFLTLFGGGYCEMRLLDETDLLESGIEIIAQPPGKRLQNIMLLSGGEKTLTALALLLAIFKYRPSPFCLLDEVDAPLDDANIGRFTRLINEMSTDTQFVLITHNKRTMEVAKYLYGVTMQEPGISQIVSVKFN